MLRVRVLWTGPTITGGGLSTHYFMHTEDQAGANAAVAAIGAFWGTVDAQLGFSTAWATDPVVAVINNLGVQTGQFTTTPASGTGALTADYGAQTTQGLISWRTGSFTAGKELRGRTFVPGITKVNIGPGGLPQPNLMSAMNAAAAALVADINTDFAIWSKKNATVANVNSGTAWNKFAVLRSRRD